MTLASTGSAYPVTPVVGQFFFCHVCTSGFEELSVSLNSALQYPLTGCLKSRKCTRQCVSCIARSHSQALHLLIMRNTNGISFDPKGDQAIKLSPGVRANNRGCFLPIETLAPSRKCFRRSGEVTPITAATMHMQWNRWICYTLFIVLLGQRA